MGVQEYSARLPIPGDGTLRGQDLKMIVALAIGAILLSFVAAVYEPGFAQALADAYAT